MSTVNWIGHWKGEDRREDWVRNVAQEFVRNNPDVRVNLSFAQDIVGEKNKRKSAEHVADMILQGRCDWDVIWLDDFIYSFVAGILKDPLWGRKHLVDFEQVPGFKETHKSFIFQNPAYRNQTGGMIVGPYVEGYLYVLWYNQKLADLLGVKVKEDGMTFDDFLSYVVRVREYNKANQTSYAAIFESNDWIMCQNIFQSLLKSEFANIADANAESRSAAKLAALRKTLEAFQELGTHRPLIRAHDTRVWFETRGEVLDDKALFYPHGTWMFSHWAGLDHARMGKMLPALLPTFRPVNHSLGGFLPTWAVLRNAPNRDVGIRLLLSMCQVRFAEMWVEYTKSPTAILGDPAWKGDSNDPNDRIRSLATSRFGERLQFSSNPAYFLGKENALLEGVVNSTLLKLLDGRIQANDAFSLIQSKTALTGSKRSLGLTLGVGMILIQGLTLLLGGLLFLSWLGSTESFAVAWSDAWIRFALGAGFCALLILGLGYLLVDRVIIRRLKATLRCVEGVEKGQHQQRIEVLGSSRDEIADLQRGVNSMIDSMERSLSDAQHAILENVDEGFFRVGRDGRMSGERSPVLEKWFGEADESCKLSDYIRRVDPERADYLEVAWEQLVEGTLPVDLLIDQLPTRVRAGRRTLALRYRPVLDGRNIAQVIVVVSDLTAEVERERVEEEARNLLGMVRMLLKDREAFLEFVREGTVIVRSITEGQLSPTELLRMLHTLKGNSAMFELRAMAELCHAIEAQLLSGGEFLPAERQSLREMWCPVAALAGPEVEGHARSTLDVAKVEHARVIHALLEGAPRDAIASTILSWSFEPVERQFSRIAERTQVAAERLGKGGLEMVVEHNQVRLPKEQWSAFWAAFVHLVRNAVDHGVESREMRVQAGKNPIGRVTLRALLDGRHVVLEVEDDGAGIDWEVVRARAAKLGLPGETQEELVQALFTDGLSSREVVSGFSGRGLGLAAVRAACVELGGTIDVHSKPGEGARFVLRIPVRIPTLVQPTELASEQMQLA